MPGDLRHSHWLTFISGIAGDTDDLESPSKLSRWLGLWPGERMLLLDGEVTVVVGVIWKKNQTLFTEL